MANYEDQNSSEYKDMNQETPAADQNPHSAGNVPQNHIFKSGTAGSAESTPE